MKLAPLVTKVLRWWPLAFTLLTVGFSAGVAGVLLASNADQLVSGFLFENYQTFRGAIFPAEHTQLLKWPLFAVLHLFHFAPQAFVVLTVIVVVVTVGSLLYILHVIDRRMVTFGALCILLASILVLVPAQAFDGSVTAPLGMAMLTGRNLEYVVYLAALALLVRTSRLRSWYFAGSALLLSLLFASDRLFTYFSFGGVALLCLAAFAAQGRVLKRLAGSWLAASLLAWVLSIGWQAMIGRTLAHLASYPQHYEYATNLTGMRHGVSGTLHALALNFGLTTRAGYASLPAFVLNMITVGLVIYAVCWTVRRLHHLSEQEGKVPLALRYAAMLLTTSFAAIGGFVLINQPYLQNARYLTITLFSGFVMLAVWLRTVRVKIAPAKLCALAIVGVAAVLLAVLAVSAHTHSLRAKDTLAQRNQKIATALQKHPVEYVVGNYWRVIPIRAATPSARQAVSPLQGCAQKTPVLTSSSWRPDLLTHSFAYLLTTQALAVPQQSCSRRLLVWQYGQPTSEVIISGSESAPREVLLFYDNGAAGVKRP